MKLREIDMEAVKASAPLWQALLASDIRRGERISQALKTMLCPDCGLPVFDAATRSYHVHAGGGAR